MPSKGKTIKVHKLTHFSTSVKLHGDPSHYNAGPYEHNNIIVKQTYRATNKQLNGDAYLKQMVHAQKRTRLISEVHAEEVGPTSYNTAYVKVRDSEGVPQRLPQFPYSNTHGPHCGRPPHPHP